MPLEGEKPEVKDGKYPTIIFLSLVFLSIAERRWSPGRGLSTAPLNSNQFPDSGPSSKKLTALMNIFRLRRRSENPTILRIYEAMNPTNLFNSFPPFLARTKRPHTNRRRWLRQGAAIFTLGLGLIQGSQAAHPLDPLTQNEIRTARKAIDATPGLPTFSYFPSITLLEPPKSEVLAFKGGAFSRRALVHAYDLQNNLFYHVIVDLKSRTVMSYTQRNDGQPPISSSEWITSDALVRANPDWQARLTQRGLKPADVYVDVWGAGDVPVAGHDSSHRLLRAITFLRGECQRVEPDGLNCRNLFPNPYARPVEGLTAAICLNDKTVIVESAPTLYPLSTESGDASALRPSLPRLTTQGTPSYTITENLVQWDNWTFRLGFNMREGPTLHQVAYKGRSILYRASLSEIYVPYARDHFDWAWRTAFDVGEYHLGQYANPLERGVEVPDNATLIDAVAADDSLTPYGLPAAVGIFEHHAGLLWSRVDPSTAVKEARGSRKLSITWNAWIGNYIYATTWLLGQDGSIEVQVGASGTLLLQGVNSHEEAEESGGYVAPNLGAPSHQHFLSFRLDFDVDGTANNAEIVDTASNPGQYGNGFKHVETDITSEGFYDGNPGTVRSFAIRSSARKNRLHHATGYSLKPGDYTPPFSAPEFPALGRAAFARHQVWLTHYKDGELFAAGDHSFAGIEGAGLPTYVSEQETLSGTDLVLWHTISFTHHPEPEEYPVMNLETLGFKLKPDNFFDWNPALDLPKR